MQRANARFSAPRLLIFNRHTWAPQLLPPCPWPRCRRGAQTPRRPPEEPAPSARAVSYTHLRAHETLMNL
eukprot:5046334-Prymnesium_polylepis.1